MQFEVKPMIRSCMSSGKLRSLKREVSFSKIEIREYERAIGDNVASSGVPISLGWEYYKAGELDVSSLLVFP